MMKSLSLAPEIATNPELSPLVDRASEVLEGELGSSSGMVSASWTLTENRGRPILQLELNDWSGRASARFSPDELEDERVMAARIVRLWGDLLQDRSHKQVALLSEESPRMDGEEVLGVIYDAIHDYTEREGADPKLLKLPIRYAIALAKLGPTFWGEWFQQIRELGIRAFDGKPLFGVPVELVFGVDTKFDVE